MEALLATWPFPVSCGVLYPTLYLTILCKVTGCPRYVLFKQLVKTRLLKGGTWGFWWEKCQEHHYLWKLEMVDKIEEP